MDGTVQVQIETLRATASKLEEARGVLAVQIDKITSQPPVPDSDEYAHKLIDGAKGLTAQENIVLERMESLLKVLDSYRDGLLTSANYLQSTDENSKGLFDGVHPKSGR